MITVFGMPARLGEREARERRRGAEAVAAPLVIWQHDAGQQRVDAERRDERRDPRARDREPLTRPDAMQASDDEADRRGQLRRRARSGLA